MAVSFLAETNRSATLRRSIESLVLDSERFAPGAKLPIAGVAFNTSSLVILPSLPVPEIESAVNPFSFMIFAAAGEGVPVA